MESYERMISCLKPLKLYRLDGTGLIEAELYAYGKVLNQLEQRIHELLKGCFLNETESETSAIWETLFGFAKTKFPLDDTLREERNRKIEKMKDRLSVTDQDFNLNGVKKYGETSGATLSISENFSNRTITVTPFKEDCFLSDRELTQFLKEVFPVGSKLVIN